MPNSQPPSSARPAHGDLIAAIERSGYYPALVAEAVQDAVGSEAVLGHLVHQETTFDADEVRRHVTVLAVTPTRLIAGHTDEYGSDDPMAPVPPGSPESATGAKAYATTSTETVPLHRISSVVVSRVVEDPANHKPGTPPREVVLTIGWGVVSRLDLEPANCGDPHCDADHGYTGTATADDVMIRVSAEADGADAVAETLSFARSLTDVVTDTGTGTEAGARTAR
jgi:hypothetical protein